VAAFARKAMQGLRLEMETPFSLAHIWSVIEVEKEWR
jgi:hypothetical protein